MSLIYVNTLMAFVLILEHLSTLTIQLAIWFITVIVHMFSFIPVRFQKIINTMSLSLTCRQRETVGNTSVITHPANE